MGYLDHYTLLFQTVLPLHLTHESYLDDVQTRAVRRSAADADAHQVFSVLFQTNRAGSDSHPASVLPRVKRAVRTVDSTAGTEASHSGATGQRRHRTSTPVVSVPRTGAPVVGRIAPRQRIVTGTALRHVWK